MSDFLTSMNIQQPSKASTPDGTEINIESLAGVDHMPAAVQAPRMYVLARSCELPFEKEQRSSSEVV